MSGKFVRASKFRHVYGQPSKRELCYENLKPTLSAFDSNIIQSNGKFIALNSNGIGSFTVIPVNEVGKAPDKVPMFRGHTGGSVLDTAFDPFDDNRIISSGEDGKILIWEIPKDYSYVNVDPENIIDVQPIGLLSGHSRKVGHLSFNPVAKDVIASSSFDYSVKIWDLNEKICKITLQHKDLITSFCWNYNGTKIATASRDKKLRIWDVRSGELLSEGPGHLGAKACRIVWLGNTNRIATTGFDRFSERQLALWNSDDLSQGPIGGFISIDSSSGTLMPFFDSNTNLLFIAGKGDGNVRYFEFADDDLLLLSEYPSTEAQRGFAVSPKRFVNVKDNEIIKSYKLLNDNSIEPLSFIVPRRSEIFQDDIYPDAPSNKPALSAAEYFDGKTVDGPILCSMRDIYDGIETPTLSASKPLKNIEKVSQPKEEPKPTAVSSLDKVTASKDSEQESKLPAFAQSQEKGVEKMLNEKGINNLLEKVNNLSDDDTQDVENNDNDGEWNEKSTSSESKKSVKSEPNVETKEGSKAEIVPTPKKEVKEELKSKEEKKEPIQAEKVSTTTSTSVKAGAAAGGLKANLDRLHTLVNSLEANIANLTLANAAKDERLSALEAKIDLLLKK
jgi:coronin-1B/1C/6